MLPAIGSRSGVPQREGGGGTVGRDGGSNGDCLKVCHERLAPDQLARARAPDERAKRVQRGNELAWQPRGSFAARGAGVSPPLSGGVG